MLRSNMAERLQAGVRATGDGRILAPELGLRVPPATGVPEYVAWSEQHQHSHAYRELMVCLEGEGLYGLGGEVYVCVPGTVFLFDCDVPHDSGYAPFTGRVVHLWVTVLADHLFARLVEAGAEGYGERVTWSLVVDRPELEVFRQWSELRREKGVSEEVAQLRIGGMLRWVVAAIVEREERGDEAAEGAMSLGETAVQAVCRHLDETAGKGASLDTLAHMAGYSKYHFLRLFKGHTGVTVLGYIDRCRRRRAAVLRKEGLTESAIAGELGFSSASSFCRWRRRQAVE